MEKKIYKFVEDTNENWFSFFSGIIASVPITLLFCFQKVGVTIADYCFFGLMIFEIVISSVTTYLAFCFTIKQNIIRSEANQLYENWIGLNQLTSENKRKEILHDVCKDNINYFKRIGILFCLLFLIMVIGIIAMWIISNFIS